MGQRILADEFGVRYALQGVYDLLHRMNLACLVPHPKHRKNDPAAMKAWVERAPFVQAVKDQHPGQWIEISRARRGEDRPAGHADTGVGRERLAAGGG